MHIIEDMLIYSRIDPFDGENTGKLEGGSAMKAVKPRGYGGILVLFVFACLLLAGSQRLIALSDTPKEIPDLSGREAWFCAAPTAAQEQLPDGQKGSRVDGEKSIAVASGQWKQQVEAISTRCDANGNILPGNGRYMKAVYQAFPLGDGFA